MNDLCDALDGDDISEWCCLRDDNWDERDMVQERVGLTEVMT